jgi:hypothetical protein
VAYCAEIEKKGIPTVQIGFEDQIARAKQVAIKGGVPEIRFVVSQRTGTGEQRIALLWDNVIKALTTPLTPKEKETGTYDPPPPARIAYEGTLLDAAKFFAQTQPIANCGDCPIMKFTDGLPIVIPTEEAVKEMLTGTSHSPDELIYRYTMNTTTNQVMKGTNPVSLGPEGLIGTVERVAVNAVMAGCLPEYLPIVLAVAGSGVGVGTDVLWQQWQVVSGPIAKEIGMDAMVGALEPGNRANRTIARSYQIMTINLGGSVVGVNRMNSIGNPGNGSSCLAEWDDGLPPGWLTLREEQGFKKTDSIVMCTSTLGGMLTSDVLGMGGTFYRGFQEGLGVSGAQGSPALRLEKEGKGKFVGKSGPFNFLEVSIDTWWLNSWGPIALILTSRMALDLKNSGMKTKDEIYQYILDKSWRTKADRDLIGFRGIVGPTEATSGKKWDDIAPTYKLAAMCYGGQKPNPRDNVIIIAGGTYEDWYRIGPNSQSFRGTVLAIDPWK